MKRIFICLFMALLLAVPVQGSTIKWVDSQVPYESLKYALEQDIATFDQGKHISWINALAVAGCRTGGRCGLSSVKRRWMI